VSVPHVSVRAGHPDFLDLDWSRPVTEWDASRLVDLPAGIHRHPVVFVAYETGIYAIKELPVDLAAHEFDVLRELEHRRAPVARVAGLVRRPWLDPHAEASGAVITRFVEFAFPYRELVTGGRLGARRNQLLDAFAGLLVELHRSGCFWGDCSLSNVLYRYDAAGLQALMIDAETSRLYTELSDGERVEDLEIMIQNVAGEMADIAAADGLDIDDADLALGEDIAARYESLWRELTAELVVAADERYLIRRRIERLNELGFAVEDVDLEPVEGGDRVKLAVRVGGRTFHSDRLRELTGIDATELQARKLLSDLRYFAARSGEAPTTATGKALAAIRWRMEVFEPYVDRIAELRPGDPIQGYADFLDFRYRLAGAEHRDVPNEEAFARWVDAGMPGHVIGGDTDPSP